jgi:tetratricopeptide (TPR) repeat protein
MRGAQRLAIVFVAILAVSAAGIGVCQQAAPAQERLATERDKDLKELQRSIAEQQREVDTIRGRVDGIYESAKASTEAVAQHADLVIKLVGGIGGGVVVLVALIGWLGYRDLRRVLARVRAVEGEARKHLSRVGECENRVREALTTVLAQVRAADDGVQRIERRRKDAEGMARHIETMLTGTDLTPQAREELERIRAAGEASARAAGEYVEQIRQFSREAEVKARELREVRIGTELSPETKQALDDVGRRLDLVEALGLPLDAGACLARGNAFYARGDYERALDCYDRAVALNAEHAEAHDRRGYALGRLGRHEQALAAHDRAVQLQPSFANAHNNRGVELRRLGRDEEGLAAYDRAIELKPDFAEAHGNRGIALGRLGRWEEALTAQNRALELRPAYAEAHYDRACAYACLGRRDDALADLRKAIKLDAKYREMAKTDEDFAGLRDDPEFRRLVGLDEEGEGAGDG